MMATTKTTTKAKAKPKKSTTKAAPEFSIDLSWLPEKSQKQVSYFLERVSEKRKCDKERVTAAVLAYVALQSTQRHGIHRLVQGIELAVRCKI
jgi:phage-related protein